MDGEEVDWCYSLAWLGHGSLTPRASVQIRVAPLEESLQQKLWENKRILLLARMAEWLRRQA